ncbi:stonustoxin subunit beta-like [Centroberyx affinis]|uniref:stonustoxin subunit beta-like n=1 Tax=Centroberyx affinis TaxID=166261 RepID=UPI003A5C5F58
MATETMVTAALGRPFTLGMLYDSRQDRLIPGFTLWDDKSLEESTVDSAQHSSAFEIIASDTIEEKSNHLNVEASLKASFLSGLVEVGGSAKYLNDTKKFQNQSRITLQYKATTAFKQLSMTHLGTKNMQYTDVFEKGLATHVVTGILFGANAFFVFDSDKSDSSHVQDIQGSMEVVIKKIPTVEISGSASFQMTDEEKKLTNNFSCKFHGDFHLKSNPTTFEDAVKTYQQLPNLLGAKGENSVPLKVWMMPLKNLNDKAPQLLNDISVGLVRKIQNALEDLSQLEMRYNESLEDKVVKYFPQIHEKMSNFKKMCKDYTFTLRQTVAKKLPSIREGKEDESALEKVFEERPKSPFSDDNLNKWMDCAEREINVLRSCVDMMAGTKTKIVKTKRELDREVLASDVEHALCFVFTSLESDDPYLKVLSDYLDSPKSGSFQPPARDQWYFSYEVSSKMREKAKEFRLFARAMKDNSDVSFIGAAVANEKYKGASIYHYRKGCLITEDFAKPQITSVETITDKTDLLWYACDLNMDPNTLQKSLELSNSNQKVSYRLKAFKYPDNPERFDHYAQVLCKEGLTGCCYWEVDWTGFVNVGVAYKGVGRKGDDMELILGGNDKSWAVMYMTDAKKGDTYTVYHNGEESSTSISGYSIKQLGVYLDWPAGTLSFYRVSSNTLSHIHTFRTKFTEPVYPGFMIWLPFCHLSLLQI